MDQRPRRRRCPERGFCPGGGQGLQVGREEGDRWVTSLVRTSPGKERVTPWLRSPEGLGLCGLVRKGVLRLSRVFVGKGLCGKTFPDAEGEGVSGPSGHLHCCGKAVGCNRRRGHSAPGCDRRRGHSAPGCGRRRGH